MELDKKIIPAINALPTNNTLVAHKILMDRMIQGDRTVTEEIKLNLTPIFS
jgi:hypothetical protein